MARTPVPGRKVRGSTTGRPVMAALDLLGRRWALRLLWELRDGPVGARALQARSDQVSASVMYERLRELAEAGLVRKTQEGSYELTGIGRELYAAIEPLDAWSQRWARATGSLESAGHAGGTCTRQDGRDDRLSRGGADDPA